MKSQLASVFVIAAVACGGRGGEAPVAIVDGTTDVSGSGVSAPVDGDVDETRATEDPADIDEDDDVSAPNDDPAPVVGRGFPAEDPVDGGAPRLPSDEQWRAHAPEQYVIRTCGYGAVPPSCSVEAVDEGHLVSRSTRFLDEPWATASIDDGTDPVAALFEEARRSIAGCTTSYELDPVYDYPSQIYTDCAQEGWGVRVTCFAPDTLDATLCQ